MDPRALRSGSDMTDCDCTVDSPVRYTWIDGIYVEVKLCVECPFNEYDGDSGEITCNYPSHPSKDIDVGYYSILKKMVFPEDCPLRVK